MSRNVFSDLGFDDDKAAEMALRVAVAVEIRRVIRERDLTQLDAKALFGVPQPTISKINKLRLEGLSLTLLLRMLFKAGLSFQIQSGGSAQSLSVCVDRPQTVTSQTSEWNASDAEGLNSADAAITRNTNQSFDLLESWDVNDVTGN